MSAVRSAQDQGISPADAADAIDAADAGWRRRWLEAALAAAADFHGVLDREGRLLDADPAFAALLRRPPAEILGKTFAELGYPAEAAAALRRRIDQACAGCGPVSEEIPFAVPGGKVGCHEYVFAPVIAADGSVEAVAVVVRDVTVCRSTAHALQQAHDDLEGQVQRRTAELTRANQLLQAEIGQRQQATQLLLESQQQLRHLAAHQQRIKEEERARIAREIHDELGQSLLALRIDVSRLEARAGNTHSSLNRRAGAALKQIDQSIQAMRAIINNLRPAVLDLGLHAAIEWQVKDFRRHGGIACDLIGGGAAFEAALGEGRAIDLFRILQEALANVLRHAQARRVVIELQHGEGSLSMTIRDDGVGFDPAQARKAGSFGLIGMRERIGYLQGQLSIDGAPGRGTTLMVWLPPIDAQSAA